MAAWTLGKSVRYRSESSPLSAPFRRTRKGVARTADYWSTYHKVVLVALVLRVLCSQPSRRSVDFGPPVCARGGAQFLGGGQPAPSETPGGYRNAFQTRKSKAGGGSARYILKGPVFARAETWGARRSWRFSYFFSSAKVNSISLSPVFFRQVRAGLATSHPTRLP